MNIALLSVYPNYFNASGLATAIEEHCGHKVTHIVSTVKPEKFYHWQLHHRMLNFYDMPNVRQCIKDSDLVIVSGIIVFQAWIAMSEIPRLNNQCYLTPDQFWDDIRPGVKTSIIISDSGILSRNWKEELAPFDTVLSMPDLFDYIEYPTIYPVLQVNDVFAPPEKPTDKVVIGHSPGNKGKTNRKGTLAIQEVIDEVSKDYDFDFKILTDLPHAECIREKAGMDIFIEQLQDPPQSYVGDGMKPFLGALGQSGQEAMCSGCATITSARLADTEPYFPNPPVLICNTKAALKNDLKALLEKPNHRYATARLQYHWACKYLNPEFVATHIMGCIEDI